MIKIFSPSGWNWDQPIAQMIKVSSRGLIGSDRSDFIKLAGATAPAFLDILDSIKFAKDEVPVHLLAMGSTEKWGPNRNGDGWTEQTLKDYHNTFEKYARWYRNHQNKDPRLSYGRVEKSAMNLPMSRVELLAALNGEKSAADRKVAFDGHILHVDNPTPSFFDISDVFRPADRTAYGTKADWLEKAASHQDFIPGAEMAEMLNVTAPLAVCLSQDFPYNWNSKLMGQTKLAMALARQEQGMRPSEPVRKSFHPVVQGTISDEQLALLGMPGSEKAAASLGALADQKVMLTLADFARWTSRPDLVKAASVCLPGIFTTIAQNPKFDARLSFNKYACSDAVATTPIRALARNLQGSHGLTQDAAAERAMRCELRHLPTPECKSTLEKSASDVPGAGELAEDYGLYKLAALYRMAASDHDFHLTASLAIGQNKVM